MNALLTSISSKKMKCQSSVTCDFQLGFPQKYPRDTVYTFAGVNQKTKIQGQTVYPQRSVLALELP